MKPENPVLIELPEIYDGYIATYYPETHTLVWRDHYIVEKLSPQKKSALERKVLKSFEDNWEVVKK